MGVPNALLAAPMAARHCLLHVMQAAHARTPYLALPAGQLAARLHQLRHAAQLVEAFAHHATNQILPLDCRTVEGGQQAQHGSARLGKAVAYG